MFPIRIWNMYDRTQDDLPRTNNHIEGWHKGFSGNCDGTHHTVWKLIRAFQRAEVAARTDLHQVLGGHPVVPKKKYADCAARVKNVVENYPARRAVVLRSIAWNLSFALFMYNFSYLFGIQIFYSCLTHDSGGFDRGLLLWGGGESRGRLSWGVIVMGAIVRGGGGRLSGYVSWCRVAKTTTQEECTPENIFGKNSKRTSRNIYG